jgi:SH3-like domain-containing protein
LIALLATKKHRFLLLALALVPVSASALEFLSVAAPKAVLYDAPSNSAKKTLLLSQFYPVEIIVNLGDWLKVRDAQGSLNWVEKKQLSTKHMVLVTADNTDIRLAPDATSSLVATVDKEVVLEVGDAKLNNGWVQVKHRDGVSGYISISSIWGVN